MQIENITLTEEDINSKVTYVPPHVKSAAEGEGGTISSWNSSFIFVNFGTGTNQACEPSRLVWG